MDVDTILFYVCEPAGLSIAVISVLLFVILYLFAYVNIFIPNTEINFITIQGLVNSL